MEPPTLSHNPGNGNATPPPLPSKSVRIVPKILVAGRAGAGKSSLLNALLGKDAYLIGTGRPTTMQFDIETWHTSAGNVEIIDSRGFAEADAGAPVASGAHV